MMLQSKSQSTSSSPSSPENSPSKKTTRLNVAGVASIFIKMRRHEEQSNPNRIVSTSGEPCSHPGLAETACERKLSVELTDNYVCVGGVNVVTLLRATRNTLLDDIEALGGTSLVNEQWKCTIICPKTKSNGTYKVQVQYNGLATRSTQADPHRPIALDQAKGIPGLMTILKRNDI